MLKVRRYLSIRTGWFAENSNYYDGFEVSINFVNPLQNANDSLAKWHNLLRGRIRRNFVQF